MKSSNRILMAIAASAAMWSCGSGDYQYDASGVFETDEVIVSAKATGEILEFDVAEGMDVSEGQVLGLIDTLQLSLQSRRLAADITAMGSRRLDESVQVASLRRQIENLQHERRRYEQLLEANAATRKQVDDIDQQISVVQSQLAATAEQLRSSNSSLDSSSEGIRAQRDQTRENIRNSVITSPIAGTVLTKYAERGEYATPGRALFKVADMSHIRLRAYITADCIADIKVGTAARVYADAGTDGRREYAGRVSWISDKAEFTPKTIQTRDERANLVYAVKIEVTNSDGLIKRGMYGDVIFDK